MTPLLGALPSDVPVATGRMQVKRGASNTVNTYGVASGLNSTFPDQVGGAAMSISVTPTQRSAWHVIGRNAWLGTVAAYGRADWAMNLSPADLNGNAYAAFILILNSGLPWHHSCGSQLWMLDKDITYSCNMALVASPGCQFHFNPAYLELIGRLVALEGY